MSPTLSPTEARAYYERNAHRQDRQGWYEDAALARLVAMADFKGAETVLEVGCGSGRFAEELVTRHLGAGARYIGLDIAWAMLDLTRRKLSASAGQASFLVAGRCHQRFAVGRCVGRSGRRGLCVRSFVGRRCGRRHARGCACIAAGRFALPGEPDGSPARTGVAPRRRPLGIGPEAGAAAGGRMPSRGPCRFCPLPGVDDRGKRNGVVLWRAVRDRGRQARRLKIRTGRCEAPYSGARRRFSRDPSGSCPWQ